MNLTNFLNPAAILELFLNRKRGNAGSLCIKHGTLSTDSSFFIEPAIAAPEFTKGPPSILSFLHVVSLSIVW